MPQAPAGFANDFVVCLCSVNVGLSGLLQREVNRSGNVMKPNERYVQYSTVLSPNPWSASAVPKYRTEDETTVTGVTLASRARVRGF